MQELRRLRSSPAGSKQPNMDCMEPPKHTHTHTQRHAAQNIHTWCAAANHLTHQPTHLSLSLGCGLLLRWPTSCLAQGDALLVPPPLLLLCRHQHPPRWWQHVLPSPRCWTRPAAALTLLLCVVLRVLLLVPLAGGRALRMPLPATAPAACRPLPLSGWWLCNGFCRWCSHAPSRQSL